MAHARRALPTTPDAAVRLPALVTRDMAAQIAVRHVLRVLLVLGVEVVDRDGGVGWAALG